VPDQFRITYGEYNNWVLPLNLAVGFHLLLALSILILPDLLKPRPKFEDIYTVDLVSMAEPAVQQSVPEPVVEPAPQPEPEPEITPKAVSIPDSIQQPPPVPQEVKPVSLKPAQRKVKKKVEDPRLDRQKELDKVKRERLAEAVRAEQLAAEQARIAAEEAERQRRLMEQRLSQIKSQVRTTPSQPRSGGQTGSSTLSALEKQYLIAIRGRIMQFWALPEYKQFDASTQAICVIKIARDGTIVDQFFERYSNDPTFDQFVKKAIRDASPLPPIPSAIRNSTFEIGLRFSPGNIQ
jgi:colicin import membrane protein